MIVVRGWRRNPAAPVVEVAALSVAAAAAGRRGR